MNPKALRAAALSLLVLFAGAVPLGAATGQVQAGTTSPPPPALAALAGRWTVDLRPSPDAQRYEKPMVLTIGADRTVGGSFYDSEIQAGRASASNGRVCFAFRTTDGAGPYQTSGCLVGDRIFGQTWAEHRQFVLNWSAVRG